MAAVTICSDLGAQKNKVWHCFHCFPIYFPWSDGTGCHDLCSISPSNEPPGLISFRMDWLDLLAVQGTLKSLLQYHSSKASILRCSTFFIVQLSHPYMTTGKTVALTRRTFVGKVMSLLFNMLSILVITILARNKILIDTSKKNIYNMGVKYACEKMSQIICQRNIN